MLNIHFMDGSGEDSACRRLAVLRQREVERILVILRTPRHILMDELVVLLVLLASWSRNLASKVRSTVRVKPNNFAVK